MALRNRKQEETSKLLGVNQVDEESDLELGAFTLLQNWIQAEIYSVKKKRGVTTLAARFLITEDEIQLITDDGHPIIIEEGTVTIPDTVLLISTEDSAPILIETGISLTTEGV